MGTGRYLKEQNPAIKVIAVEPPLGERVEGLRNLDDGYIPPVFEQWYGFELLDRKRVVRPARAWSGPAGWCSECGVFAGISSGAALAGAAKVASEIERGRDRVHRLRRRLEVPVDRRLHRRPRRGREAGRKNHLLLSLTGGILPKGVPEARTEITQGGRLNHSGGDDHLCRPDSPGSRAQPSAASFIKGSSRYQAVAPFRLADTRPEQGAFDSPESPTRSCGSRSAGKGNVPRQRSAAVLNVTGVNTTAPGYVTVYPADTDLPTASNVNFDGAGQVMANMVTVKLGAGGAVDVYMQRPMDVAVDVSGAYVPVTKAVSSGRLVTLPSGAFRVLDTRVGGVGLAPGDVKTVDVSPAGVPADAIAVVVNITATDTGVGFWTAFPLNQIRPNASNLNIDTPGQTRAGQAIVLLSGGPAFNVFSMGGGDLIVDVAGWFTGATDGRRRPTACSCRPTRRGCSTRAMFVMPTWGGSTLELPVYGPAGQVSASPSTSPVPNRWSAGSSRHSLRESPDRRRRTSTSTRGIRRSPTTPSSGSAIVG